ncbi:TdeIII family type II restriction endonuclease [Clostridia bacterium]|nr:TdeIII family type II restriction endonuclease [Clostridia bacterium]
MNELMRKSVENTITMCLRNKLNNYSPESKAMPFHYRLLGKDRMSLFSFIHSLNTVFGTSIFEPVAKTLAKERFAKVELQYTVGDKIYQQTQTAITEIMDDIIASIEKPNKPSELAILGTTLSGNKREVHPTKVDLYLEDNSGGIYLFDLKSPKPNKGEFKGFKRTLLEWAGVALAVNGKVNVNTMIAIPYNPYEPGPYERWTMAGMLDVANEVKVAAEFWDFLGGEGSYAELLDCFERVGVEMRDEIDLRFAKFKV